MKITALAYATAIVAIGGVSGCGSDAMVAAQGRPVIRMVDGNNVASIAGLRLPIASVVVLETASGTPIANVNVLWTVASGGGTLTGEDNPGHAISGPVVSLPSNSSGMSLVVWTLGATLGHQTMTAAVKGFAGSPVTFSATATPP